MRLSTLLSLLLLGGCSLFSSDTDDTTFRTDAGRYEARRTGYGLELDPIAFTFTNARSRAVYVPGCPGPNPPSLQKLVNGAWVEAWSPVVTQCLGPSVRVGAGQAYRDTLHVLAGLPSDNLYPKFETLPVEGTYRLVLGVDRTEDPERIVPTPLGERVSNPFELREASN
ncbi:MAG: hypothetical protein ABJF88_02185 [Rhodothermales bacterium]